ncbi:MAG: hydrogenase maturation nickel metallochaperone HypA [Candidatus Omnitrophica bacterium]|nr:hydrogenase maturation nickel metallochaperone HypA [Candidatus Omnitrophota bacterium]
MHELSIAQNLFEACKKIAKEHSAESIKTINVTVSPLSHINAETLEFLLKNIAESENSALMEKTQVKLKKDISPDSREIVVNSIEMEEQT